MRVVPLAALAVALAGGLWPSLQVSQVRAAAEPKSAAAESKSETPLACNLSALTSEERARHFNELGPQLRSLKKSVRGLAEGYEFEFPPDPATYRLLTEWAAGERLCCPFFDVEIRSTREGGPLWLRLTGREGVKRFIEIDGAAWLKP